VPDERLRDAIFSRIRDEHALTLRHYLAIHRPARAARGQSDARPEHPQSLSVLDPLKHVQVELLRRYRAGDTGVRAQRAIHLTINGLAAGIAQQRIAYNSRRIRGLSRTGRARRISSDSGAMRILLSNDDGYFAPGLEHLAAALAPHAEITVVAPGARPQRRVELAHARSAAVGATRAERLPVRQRHAHRLRSPRGHRPARYVARHGDLGINLGANMGDDTIYSGTVAAATEGFLLGVPSVAISLASKTAAHFETAAPWHSNCVERHRRRAAARGFSTSTCPTVARAAIRGYASRGWAAAQGGGRRSAAEPARRTVYWVGAAGAAADAGEGTDFHAVESATCRSRRCRST
jgi:5'-nucleotidase